MYPHNLRLSKLTDLAGRSAFPPTGCNVIVCISKYLYSCQFVVCRLCHCACRRDWVMYRPQWTAVVLFVLPQGSGFRHSMVWLRPTAWARPSVARRSVPLYRCPTAVVASNPLWVAVDSCGSSIPRSVQGPLNTTISTNRPLAETDFQE